MHLTQIARRDGPTTKPSVESHTVLSTSNLINVMKLDFILTGRRWRFKIPKAFFETIDPKSLTTIISDTTWSKYLRIFYSEKSREITILSRRYLRMAPVTIFLIGDIWGLDKITQFVMEEHENV